MFFYMALFVGHSLTGLAIAKKTKINPFLAIVLANLPDIDYLFGLFLKGDALSVHRSFTHSPSFAFLAALVFWIWGKYRKVRYLKVKTFGVGLLIFSHYILDFYMPFFYQVDESAGRNGFWSFIWAHILSFEFLYNNSLDLLFYGALYVFVVKFIFKQKLL